jgi:hypothetical protein
VTEDVCAATQASDRPTGRTTRRPDDQTTRRQDDKTTRRQDDKTTRRHKGTANVTESKMVDDDSGDQANGGTPDDGAAHGGEDRAGSRADQRVGYGKPPKRSQFKKSQCANPKGRGKDVRNLASVVAAAGEKASNHPSGWRTSRGERAGGDAAEPDPQRRERGHQSERAVLQDGLGARPRGPGVAARRSGDRTRP